MPRSFFDRSPQETAKLARTIDWDNHPWVFLRLGPSPFESLWAFCSTPINLLFCLGKRSLLFLQWRLHSYFRKRQTSFCHGQSRKKRLGRKYGLSPTRNSNRWSVWIHVARWIKCSQWTKTVYKTESYFTYGYSPVYSEDGSHLWRVCFGSETTGVVSVWTPTAKRASKHRKRCKKRSSHAHNCMNSLCSRRFQWHCSWLRIIFWRWPIHSMQKNGRSQSGR